MTGARGGGVVDALGSAASAVVSAGAAAAVWGVAIERTMFTLRRQSVPVLPAGCPPIRVLHLSDLHMAPWQTGKQDWLRALADLEPDLVVDTGDNLGHAEAIGAVAHALAPLAGIPGVFVNGSNDYFGPSPRNPLKYFTGPSRVASEPPRLDLDGLHAVFRDLGWRDLDNTATELTVKGVRLELFGVDDPHRRFDRLDAMTGALDELREEREDAHPDAEEFERRSAVPTVSIGVAHAPYRRILDSFVTHGAEVIFAGHTHGGQVCVPGYGALVTNCDLPRSQASGLSTWRHGGRRAWLTVSAGLGTSIYAPVRFACPPEATLLTLEPVR